MNPALSCWKEGANAALVWTRPERAIDAFRRILSRERVTQEELFAEVDEFASLIQRASERVEAVFVPLWTMPAWWRGTGGLVTHVSVADPFCSYLNEICYAAVGQTGNPVHKGGAFIAIEGPRFSTKVESRIYRSWGLDIIGMTTTPEAQLAREAEMSYSVMAHVTDYDVWHETDSPVTVEMVIRTLLHNADVAKTAVANAIRLLANAPASPYANAMKDALITNRAAVPPAVVERLQLIVGKYYGEAV